MDPLSNYYGTAETLRGPVYPRYTKVQEGIVRRESALEAPVTECTFPLEVHSVTVMLIGGDAQRPSSDRLLVKALDDGSAVGHHGYSSGAECSLSDAFGARRHSFDSVKKALSLYKKIGNPGIRETSDTSYQ